MTPRAPARTATRTLAGPDATAAFAEALAPRLAPGDAILLSGGLGAGKTHFARALIQARLAVPEDVPSPTFTLVQIYETPEAELWHADLYRLTGPDEVIELGLDAAFEAAICLVEWPDRLGGLAPAEALDLTLVPGGSDAVRELAASWSAPRWNDILSGLLT